MEQVGFPFFLLYDMTTDFIGTASVDLETETGIPRELTEPDEK